MSFSYYKCHLLSPLEKPSGYSISLPLVNLMPKEWPHTQRKPLATNKAGYVSATLVKNQVKNHFPGKVTTGFPRVIEIPLISVSYPHCHHCKEPNFPTKYHRTILYTFKFSIFYASQKILYRVFQLWKELSEIRESIITF